MEDTLPCSQKQGRVFNYSVTSQLHVLMYIILATYIINFKRSSKFQLHPGYMYKQADIQCYKWMESA